MRSVLIVALLLSFLSSNAQTALREGYVVLQKGDTLRGLIQYRESDRIFTRCEFTNKAGVSFDYTPSQLQAFRFDGDKMFLSIDLSQVTNPQEGLPEKQVFAELLVKGALNLFHYDEYFFVQTREGDMYQLYSTTGTVRLESQTNEYTPSATHSYYQEKREYAGILKYLTQDCDNLYLDNTKFLQKDLTKAVIKYHECAGHSYQTFKDGKPWFQFNLSFELGGNYSQLRLDDDVQASREHLSSSFDPSFTIYPGIIFDFSSPRINESLSFQVGLLYLSNTYQSTFELYNGYTRTNHDVTFKISQLKLPFAVGYTFPGKNLRPFILGGLSTSFYLSSTSLWKHDRVFADNTTSYQENTVGVDLNSSQVGIHGSLGLKKKMSSTLNGYLKVSFEYNNGIIRTNVVDHDFAKSNILNIMLSTGIQL